MKKVLFLFILLATVLPKIVLAEQIDINSATLSQLDELTGIGQTYAQRIINARPFSSVDDLLRIKGIGPATLQKIKTQGWACVNCQNQQTPQQTTQVQNTTTTEPIIATTSPSTAPVTQTLATIYPSGIFINEIMPNPQGPDGTDEWIELYNSNNSEIDLAGWQLQDKQGTTTTFTILPNTRIMANGFKLFQRPDTNIMLNNDNDGLNLLTPDKKIVDSVNFSAAPLGQSYNRINSNWQWSTTPTPGTTNIITAVAAKTVAKALPNKDNSVTNNVVTAGLTDNLPAQAVGSVNPWFLFFIVLGTTIILAVVVLIIKLKTHVRT